MIIEVECLLMYVLGREERIIDCVRCALCVTHRVSFTINSMRWSLAPPFHGEENQGSDKVTVRFIRIGKRT